MIAAVCAIMAVLMACCAVVFATRATADARATREIMDAALRRAERDIAFWRRYALKLLRPVPAEAAAPPARAPLKPWESDPEWSHLDVHQRPDGSVIVFDRSRPGFAEATPYTAEEWSRRWENAG